MHVSRDQSQLLMSGDVHLEHCKHFIINRLGACFQFGYIFWSLLSMVIFLIKPCNITHINVQIWK